MASDQERTGSRPLGVIGVPTSAGAFAPGQEQAPQAMRDAGLLGSLRRCGLQCRDHGDRDVWRWRPDRANRRAQNLDQVIEIVKDTGRRVNASIKDDEATLVLGGDCTVGIGTVAGHVSTGGRLGLIYFDLHADLNVPESGRAGALDWMGLAHMLAEPGAAEKLIQVGSRVPLLEVAQVLLFAWGPEQATEFEREVIDRRGLSAVTVDQVAADPEGAAAHALELIESRCERLLIHFDVDVIDFTDTPLSENTGRNEGLTYDHALRALHPLLRSPRFAGLTITELNPDHTEAGAQSIERFVANIADSLAPATAA